MTEDTDPDPLSTTAYRDQREKTPATDQPDTDACLRWRAYARQQLDRLSRVKMYEPSIGHGLAVFRCVANPRTAPEYHDLRVRSDLLTTAITIHDSPDEPVVTGKLAGPTSRQVFLQDQPPQSVQRLVDTLDLDPRWGGSVCAPGEHRFLYENGRHADRIFCLDCQTPRAALSYRGHSVPYGVPAGREADSPPTPRSLIRDDDPGRAAEIEEVSLSR